MTHTYGTKRLNAEEDTFHVRIIRVLQCMFPAQIIQQTKHQMNEQVEQEETAKQLPPFHIQQYVIRVS